MSPLLIFSTLAISNNDFFSYYSFHKFSVGIVMEGTVFYFPPHKKA